jgi:glycosyltransferase involved in cell wall biosynthesis
MTTLEAGQPLVSVVIPCLNRAKFLVPTLESILRQDYPHIECIVIDGGSTDGTLDILRSYGRQIQWLSEPDAGPPDAINKGWRMCSGEILAWLNADDLWAPGAIREVVAQFEQHPKADVVYGDCGIIDGNGEHIKTVHVKDWDLRYAVKHCDHIIFQPASFLRRTILERVGWLYPNLCHDHELWLRIGLAGEKFHRLPVILAYARDHLENLGLRSELVIPLKLDLTRNFFCNPDVPEDLRADRERAISNAHLRGIDYIFFDQFNWRRDIPRVLDLLSQAVRSDRSNIFQTLRYCFGLPKKIADKFLQRYLPDRLYRDLRAAKHRLREKLYLGYRRKLSRV